MKLIPKNKGRCILEVEELLNMSAWRDQEELVEVINSSGASRKAYNMWLFPTVADAEEFVFMYRLKYEDENRS
jgi:hypothetical protein